ncbi:MAG: hypothetical protein HY320_16275 [Armatimonadetes bacterium]|nr:hypothetical protein [Armatimonadota bacterium]
MKPEPVDERIRYYLKLLQFALMEIRYWAAEGDAARCHSIAYAFDHVPQVLLRLFEERDLSADAPWIRERMHEIARAAGWKPLLDQWEEQASQVSLPPATSSPTLPGSVRESPAADALYTGGEETPPEAPAWSQTGPQP